MDAGHGLKDVDDFILTLIRHPAFSEKVKPTRLLSAATRSYQPVLDRLLYRWLCDVPGFIDVRKVWRNTSQFMCGTFRDFFEQLFPLVRALNQKLLAGKAFRVLPCDPPLDWDAGEKPCGLPQRF